MSQPSSPEAGPVAAAFSRDELEQLSRGDLVELVLELQQTDDELRAEVERLLAENAELRTALDEAQRAGKRQASPFSKNKPKANPKKPGRKRGRKHGKHGHRKAPKEVDEVVDVPLPGACGKCGGTDLEPQSVAQQYQADIPPVQPHVTQFNIAIGSCGSCGARVQGRDEQQTSDALGAAASQLGPRALAMAAHLNKGFGLSFEKIASFFSLAFNLTVTRGALCTALHRVADASAPTYDAMCESARAAAVVAADETGWRVGGRLQWLWVVVTNAITVYAILPGRGFKQAKSLLGETFSGVLVRDGWATYRKFKHAVHQTCLAHLLRRCHDMLKTAKRGAARFPRAVRGVLKDALRLRDRKKDGQLTAAEAAAEEVRIRGLLDGLLRWKPTDESNRKFAKHLRAEQDALLTFLTRDDVAATNHEAERAIRPAVVTRKVCGGNRTWRGARTQAILASILRTCAQQGRDYYAITMALLRSPTPRVAKVLIPPPPPAQPKRDPPS